MTVKELIEILKQCDENSIVVVHDNDGITDFNETQVYEVSHEKRVIIGIEAVEP